MIDLLKYTEEDKLAIWKHYNITEETIKENIEILKTWIGQQQHLPHNQSDGFLERILLRNKFRIEQAKRKIEAYYTLRGCYRKYYQKCNDDMIPSREVCGLLPLPNLTPNLERVHIVALTDGDPSKYDPVRQLTYNNLLLELLMRHDYALADRFIIDGRKFTMDHYRKFTLADVTKCYSLYKNAYLGRKTGIDFIYSSPMLNLLANLFKLVLPKKLHSRLSQYLSPTILISQLQVNFHDNLESLYKVCPKRCLPEDYGGDLECHATLNRRWDKVFDENRKFFDDNYNDVADETLRVREIRPSEFYGVDGTFKKLNTD